MPRRSVGHRYRASRTAVLESCDQPGGGALAEDDRVGDLPHLQMAPVTVVLPTEHVEQGGPRITALPGAVAPLSCFTEDRAHIERALQAKHDLSMREYSLLDVLSRQHDGDGGHLQMRQVADAVVLSQSCHHRLVTRLEDAVCSRGYLCPTDRRGIYTNVSRRVSHC